MDMATKDRNPITQHALDLANREWGEVAKPQSLSGAFSEFTEQPESLRLDSMNPWFIVTTEPRAQEAATKSLQREGFEVYQPVAHETIRVQVPLRKLPSKTRHRRQRAGIQEVTKEAPVFGSYMFIRRISGCYDLSRLYELHGVGGICLFGEMFALVPDYVVELIRLKEARGGFDSYNQAVQTLRRPLKVETNDPGLMKEWTGGGRHIKDLDDSDRALLFVRDAFGRVTRIITSPDNALAGSR